MLDSNLVAMADLRCWTQCVLIFHHGNVLIMKQVNYLLLAVELRRQTKIVWNSVAMLLIIKESILTLLLPLLGTVFFRKRTLVKGLQ